MMGNKRASTRHMTFAIRIRCTVAGGSKHTGNTTRGGNGRAPRTCWVQRSPPLETVVELTGSFQAPGHQISSSLVGEHSNLAFKKGLQFYRGRVNRLWNKWRRTKNQSLAAKGGEQLRYAANKTLIGLGRDWTSAERNRCSAVGGAS